MTRCQSSLPAIWLISDARNDAVLEAALAKLPRGSGLVFRHYHLPAKARRARFERLRRIARRFGHVVVLAGSAGEARRWKAQGSYCSPAKAGASGGRSAAFAGTRFPPSQGRSELFQLSTAHSLREIGAARRDRADAVLLSPVYPTRSHPGARTLGPLRFRLLAARAGMPVIALGGMTPRRAERLRWPYWAAIDGLSSRDS